ncbi:hypothetical protein BY458DRAFT_557100 [Sporodiniella umbellata]|nr:hypothetical protein BY458DRAFT_557100 [Sporodiniella umbellata]
MRFSLLLISTLATLTYFTSAMPMNGHEVAQAPTYESPELMKRFDDEHWDEDDCEDEEEHRGPREKTIYFFHTVTATTTITKGHDHDDTHDRDHGGRDGGRGGGRGDWDHGFDLGHLFDHHRELNVPTGASAIVAAPTAAAVSV